MDQGGTSPEPDPEPNPESKPDVNPEPNPESKPDVNPEPSSESDPEPLKRSSNTTRLWGHTGQVSHQGEEERRTQSLKAPMDVTFTFLVYVVVAMHRSLATCSGNILKSELPYNPGS